MATVTVLLPVRNGEKWLGQCLEALVEQSYKNFKVLLVDDGSTDRTVQIATAFDSLNMRIVRGPRQGLAQALAMGVRAIDSPYIARQDHDDWSYPDRLEEQVRFLEDNPDVVAVGSQARFFSESRAEVSQQRLPTSDHAIRLRMLLFNPFVHTSVMMRRDAVLAAGNYQAPSSEPYPEDFDLWIRLGQVGKLRNLNTTLVGYRVSDHSTSAVHSSQLAVFAGRIAARNVEEFLGGSAVTPKLGEVLTFFHKRKRKITPQEAVRLLLCLLRVRAKSGFGLQRKAWSWRVYAAPFVWALRQPEVETRWEL